MLLGLDGGEVPLCCWIRRAETAEEVDCGTEERQAEARRYVTARLAFGSLARLKSAAT